VSRTPQAKSSKRRSKAPAKAPDISWIQTLAAPYLRGYRAAAKSRGPLRGYRFLARRKTGAKTSAGFFVGYLLKPENHEFLHPEPPECAVFAFIEPVNSASYRRLVTTEGSLLRRTAEYISWLTHRRPRFAFFENRTAVLVRHFSMRAWPPEKHRHFSRNFFIETLAWLVRSGLVAKLASQASVPRATRPSGKHKS
jgi:hypothetical protein